MPAPNSVLGIGKTLYGQPGTVYDGYIGASSFSYGQPAFQVNQPFQQLYSNVTSMIASGKIKQSFVYLPNFHFHPSNLVTAGYTSTPAPMGLADFGLGASGSYTYYTPSFNGSVLLDSYSANSPVNAGLGLSPNSSGIQFNTVLTNVTVGGMSNGVYWTQNVALLNSTSLTFIDNIWNFTSAGATLGSSGIYSGNGHAVNFYYYVAPAIPISYPLKLSFYNNATVYNNHPAMFFNYSYRISGGPLVSGSYDRVLFNSSVTPLTPVFEVNGTSPNPAGLLYDSELTFGGPGGGSNAMIQNLSGQISISYLSGGTYHSIPSAYSYGSDTGETSEGMATYWIGHTGYLSQGPSNLSGLWNTAGGAAEGYITLNAIVTPGWAFAFAGEGTLRTFAPVTQDGFLNFSVSPGGYNLLLMANDYAKLTSFISSNTTTGFGMTSVSNLLYTPVYMYGNTNALGITAHLSAAGRLSNLTITLNNSFMGVNDFRYPLFGLVAAEGVTTSVVVQNVSESNSYYYYDGAAYASSNYTQIYDIISSSSLVVKNISLPGPVTSHYYRGIRTFDSSNILVRNVSANTSSSDPAILLYDSQMVSANYINVTSGLGIVAFYSTTVSVNNLNVQPAVNGSFTYGLEAVQSSSVAVSNVQVDAVFSGTFTVGAVFVSTNHSSVTGLAVNGNSSSLSTLSLGGGAIYSSNDTFSGVSATTHAIGFLTEFAADMTFSNVLATADSFAMEGLLTNKSNVSGVTANDNSGGAFMLGSYDNITHLDAANDSLASYAVGQGLVIRGITASDNSTALEAVVNDSSLSYINGTFSQGGFTGKATSSSLPFVVGYASNSTLSNMNETGYYAGLEVDLSSSSLKYVMASHSHFGLEISGNDSTVSSSNSSYGGDGFVISSTNSTFSNLYVYQDSVGFNMTGSSDIITKNSISDETSYGVAIYAGRNNYVYNNNFLDNNGSTGVYSSSHIQAYSVAGNYFNLSLTGNYWADWHLAYSNGTLEPYLISNGVYDNHPLGSNVVIGYQVTFQANGLASGIEWFVNLTNGQSFHSTASTIVLYEPNATYSYSVASGNSSWAPSKYTGTFQVAGYPVSVPISFSLVTYSVTFTASGLSSGTNWTVAFGSQSRSSTTATIVFSEPNGTYQYSTASIAGYRIASGSGSLKVHGVPTGATIAFSVVTYTITITETGLPSGTTWQAVLNNVAKSTSTGTLIFTEPNGTYSFTISNTTSYYVSPYTGKITVSGSNASQSVQFTQYSYITGTVSPSNATVTINGVSVTTSGGLFNVTEAAGTYSVVVSAPGYKTYYNNVTLSTGQTENLPVTLQAVTHPVPAPASSFTFTDIILIVVIAAVILVALAVVLTRRKKQGRS